MARSAVFEPEHGCFACGRSHDAGSALEPLVYPPNGVVD
ncbi:hypothetical protein YT1_0260 [Rhodococcus ruber]|nr:hypothetical protein YT1_0260 [Rhodococcus ruber]